MAFEPAPSAVRTIGRQVESGLAAGDPEPADL